MTEPTTTALVSYQSDLAKLLFASLLVINIGAAAGLLHHEWIPVAIAIDTAGWFAAGIGLTMASGFCSWWNTAQHLAHAQLDSASGQFKADEARLIRQIYALAIGSVVLGCLALTMAAVGAWLPRHS